MCGIVALFSHRAPIVEAALRRATASLHHRGPDGQGHWISSDRRVALGHARLSIIDLATGTSRSPARTGRRDIVVNGEFYGYEPIQRELEQSGHRLRTRSDSEIALHLYEDLGAQCLHRLRGEFAFVLWDETNRTHLRGARPFRNQAAVLCRARWHALFRVGSEGAVCSGRAGALGCRVRLSVGRAIGGHQVRTLFDGIFQVPPGHYLIATEKHLQINQYWDFQLSARRKRREPQRSDAEWASRVPARPRGGGAHSPARRCAGWLLPERWPRFLRRARSGGETSH